MKKNFFAFFVLVSATARVFAINVDTFSLADEIAKSISDASKKNYSTIAFSRIQGTLNEIIVRELIDFTNVAIVKNRKFRVIDRTKLQQTLKEQSYNLSELVSPDAFKEVGKLLGVDLFLYGHAYENYLILKAIDVQTSAIVWADRFKLDSKIKDSDENKLIAKLTDNIAISLRKDLERLKVNRINQISFWGIQGPIDNNKLSDFISVKLTQDNNFQVIDRETLATILKEQKLNQSDFFDEDKAKQMGKLYGIDAFVYGSFKFRKSSWVGSFKMMNLYNGVIEWADLIQLNESNLNKYSRPVSSRDVSGSLTTSSKILKDKEMIFIPEGTFIKGDKTRNSLSFPEYKASTGRYYIDTFEVSNKEYKIFVEKFKHRTPPYWYGGRIPPGKEDLPVVMVNWKDANRYCKSFGKRLPTENEWEKANRGTKGYAYPWGNIFRASWTVTRESGKKEPESAFVRKKDVSSYGVYNLAGNVREWTSDTLLPYPGNTLRTRKYNREKVIRGGSWAQDGSASTAWYRSSSKPTYGWPDVGFRCVKSAS